VQQGHNVLVIRTFSKIYGMAGARVGFGCAPAEMIKAMLPYKDNIVPILGLRAAMAALNEAPTLIPKRRANFARIRSELCAWLRQKKFAYIESHANFVMTDIRRDVREFGQAMFRKGVAVGRPFPPLNTMLRITLGTDQEMAKFREVFTQVYGA
jgi:histidinol-phosphate/aromatic aminotransferase/cobyric acid decarboxylase-like protein